MASGRRTTEVAEDAAATSVIDAGPAEADAEPDVAGQTVVVAKEPSAAGPPKPQSRDISPDAYLVFRCIATVAALWMCHRGLSAEIPAGVDIGGHVVRTEYAFDLFGQGRLDGWFPGFGSGYRLFGVNGPGLSLASGLVRTVMLGSVTTARSFALLGGLAFAALPWAVAALSRSLGSSRLAASIHGVLALAVSFYGGGGLAGLYEIGLIAQAVALPLQVVALAAVVRAVRDGGRRHLAVAALLVGVLGLLHPISILVVVVLVPFLTGHEVLRTPTRWAGRLTLVGMWAAAVAGYWLLPAIRLRDLRGGVTGWGIPPLPTRLGDIVGGHDLLPRAIAVAALVALVVVTVRAVRRPDLRYRLRLPIAALAFLIVAHYAYGHGIGPYEVVSLLPTRGLALMGVLLLQPLAEVLADVANVLRRRWAAAGGLVVVGCAICVPWLVSGRLDPPQVAEPATGSFLDAAAYLEQAVPPMGRHLMVNPPNSGVTGTGHAVRWMAAASGTNSAHLYLWEATRENAAGVIANDLLATVEPADAAGQLRRLGVTHVVVASLDQANRLAAADGAFWPVMTSGEVTVLEVEPADGAPEVAELLQPAEDGGAYLRARSVRQEPEHLGWEVEVDYTGSVVAAVAYDPGWSATVDGERVDVERSADGLVQLHLEPGDRRIELRFRPATVDRLAVLVTVAGLLAAAYALGLHQRIRRFRLGSGESVHDGRHGT